MRVGCVHTVLMILFLGVALAGQEAAFEDVLPGRVFVFPIDHGKHQEFQTEWWYFTGNLQSAVGRWGFQLTFFRRSLLQAPAHRDSSWAVRDLYPAHFALCDATNRAFFHADLISREGPGLAGAAADDLKVWVKDWRAERQGEAIVLTARSDGHALDLRLMPGKPPVLHGKAGFSRKGDAETQASYYYSLTRLKADGTITVGGVVHTIDGWAWMDHEFGSSLLLPDQAGWDWFSVQLDDRTEIMVFRLRKKDGSLERPFGTYVLKDGRPVDLAGHIIRIEGTETWKSPHTGAEYPSGWKIEIPSQKISLELEPLLKDQELATTRSTSVTYWEGAVSVKGTKDGVDVTGSGYAELTGYAHAMAGRL